MVRAVLLVLVCCGSLFGQQVELAVTKQTAIVNLQSPRVVGDVVLLGENSKPSLAEVAEIKVNSESDAIDVVAYRTSERFQMVFPRQVNKGTYLLSEPGDWNVQVEITDWEKRTKLRNNAAVSINEAPDSLVEPVNLSGVAKESRLAMKLFVASMANDFVKLSDEAKKGSFQTVAEAATAANTNDSASRAAFKAAMAKIMQPKLGNDKLPSDAAQTFLDIATGFRGVK